MMRSIRCALYCAAIFVGCGLWAQRAAATELESLHPAEIAAAEAVPSQLVVIRLTEAWFTSRINRRIDEQSPVDQVILNTRVRGTARTVGVPKVELLPSPHHGGLRVVLSGTTVSRTVGRNGPAIIQSRSETTFRATKQVVFTPGKGFTAEPAEIHSDTRTMTEKVSSTRGGLIGRVVQRQAWKKIEESRPLTTQIARGLARQRICDAFDRQVEDMLVQLNRSADLRETIAMLRGRTNGPRYSCRSTDKYVEFALAGTLGENASCPPALANYEAPIQVWVHRSLVPTELAPAIAQIQRARESIEGLIDRFARVVPVGAGIAEQPVAVERATNAMHYQFVDDWTVLSWQDARPAVSLADFGSGLRR